MTKLPILSSQSSAVTHLRCGGQCNKNLVANLLPNSTVKKCENRLIFARVMDRRIEVPFLTNSVYIILGRESTDYPGIKAHKRISSQFACARLWELRVRHVVYDVTSAVESRRSETSFHTAPNNPDSSGNIARRPIKRVATPKVVCPAVSQQYIGDRFIFEMGDSNEKFFDVCSISHRHKWPAYRSVFCHTMNLTV